MKVRLKLCALCYLYTGEFEQAVALIKRAIDIEPENGNLHLNYARQLIMRKNYDEAEKEIALADKIEALRPRARRLRALIFAAKGEKESALSLIKEEKLSYLYDITGIYSILGMKDEAIKKINDGIEKGFQAVKEYLYAYPFLATNPFFDNLRNDPGFKEILEKQRRDYEHKKVRCGQ